MDAGRVAVVAVTLALATLAAALHFFALPGVEFVIHIDWLPWWVLAIAFLLFERFSVYLQWRDQAVVQSLTDLPVVIGLASVGAHQLILAALLAQVAFRLVWRPLPLVKAAFNIAWVWLELTLLVAVLGWVAGGVDVTMPATWLLLAAVLITTSVLGNVLVALNVRLSGGEWRPLLSLRLLRVDTAVLLISLAFAVVATLAIIHYPYALLPVVGLTAVMLFAFREHRRATDRYESMMLLSRQLEQAVSQGGSHGWTDLLQQLAAMFGAHYVELCTFDPGGSGTAQLHALGPRGAVVTRLGAGSDALVVRDRLAAGGKATVLDPDALPNDIPAAQRERGAIVTPLVVGEHQVGLLLVAGRASVVGPFSGAQADQLGFFAKRFGQAVAQGRLVERLRDEVDTLQKQKFTDTLTGLPTQSAFYETMHGGPPDRAAFAVIGIANLAEVNRVLGREGGDRVVAAIAGMLGGLSTYRFPGAKFAVTVPDSDARGALGLLQERLADAADPLRIGEANVLAEVYCGIAGFPGDGHDPNSVLESAALAMEQARREHRRFVVYSAPAVAGDKPGVLLEGDLAAAIREGTIDVFFQPQVQLQDGELFGAEVLARWRHAEHGYIRPDIFIPLAERTGLIHDLTLLIMRKAFAACAAWQERGFDLGVSINLSAYDFRHEDLPGTVARLIEEYRIAPQYITLEITESILMDDIERSTQLTRVLHDLGVRISIDDFGTGYSSLAYLARLPLNEIKIDKSFVTRMDESSVDATIVETMIDLGHKLGLIVCAEGIESGQVIRQLTVLACDQAQGYFVARPMAAAEFDGWLRRDDQLDWRTT